MRFEGEPHGRLTRTFRPHAGNTRGEETTAGKYDVFAFLLIASGEYIGFAGSLNH